MTRVRLGIASLAVLACLGSAAASVTPTAKDFTSQGVIRAKVRPERSAFTPRLEGNARLETLVKENGKMMTPSEPKHVYDIVDPVPLESSKVYTPWLTYFKEAVVFVIGRLDKLRIARWSVQLRDTAGREIRAFSGLGNPPQAFFWNGRDQDYRPVAVGQGYVPEITLTNVYGAKVNLPQRVLRLEQFLWQEPGRIRLGCPQEDVFRSKRTTLSQEGGRILQEASNLISVQDGDLLTIECLGPDLDLSRRRAETLKTFFARENLRVRQIEVRITAAAGESILYLDAARHRR